MLQEFDTGIPVGENEIPDQLYLDLAWEGFNHSDIVAWQNIVSSGESARIDAVISNYVSNSPLASYLNLYLLEKINGRWEIVFEKTVEVS